MDKRLLLLDVDGAISADAIGNPAAHGYAEHCTGHGRVVLSDHVNAQLVAMQGLFDLVWCTGWNHKANLSLSPLIGLPQLPVCDLADARQAYERSRWDGTFVAFPQRTWKIEAIQRYVGDRPFALVDDQIGDDLLAWCRSRRSPSLLVAVNAARGLSERDFMLMRACAATPGERMTLVWEGQVRDRS